MKQKIRGCGWLFAMMILSVFLLAEIRITKDFNDTGAATKEFKFKNVPSPAKDDAAAQAKLTVVDGEIDGNSAGLSALIDGKLPAEEDDPAANFFFNAGTAGGRFRIDLGSVIEIAQVNTYSWHPNTRGPQLYKLYASDGTDPKFNPAPLANVDPTTVGWTQIAVVDTRPLRGDGGGQHGVSIGDPAGSLGSYRHLLFSCTTNEIDDDYGNTFYSEIDIIAKNRLS